MRKFYITALILTTILPTVVYGYISPGQPQGFVNDFAGILSAADRQAIEIQLQDLERSTGAEVAMVTINSLGDETIETYAVKLFEAWGIGKEKEDNGLLILVAPNDREVKIEVGYGLEDVVTDLQSGNIIRNVMVPAFQQSDYATGIKGSVDAISAVIRGSPEAAQYLVPQQTEPQGSDLNFAAIFFLIIFAINIFSRILGKTKSWWLGGVIGAGIGGIIGLIVNSLLVGGIAVSVLTVLGLIFDYFVSKRPPGSGGHGGFWPIFFGGGRGGRGGMGGFGGFGGGISGGGGASGRW